jgi:hypothetical protein
MQQAWERIEMHTKFCNHIKMDLVDVDWIYLAQDKNQ